MSQKIRVDFFHDVICGWCYVFSPRLRRLASEFDLDVHHHAFALSPTRADQIRKFGSVKQAKQIILGHWEQCAKADDQQRINVDGMRQQTFDYPISTPGLVACKAAWQQGGADTYWDYFDAVTHAHLSENRNIADPNVLAEIAADIGLDKVRFMRDVSDPGRQQEIRRDQQLAREYGISSTPTLVIEQKWMVPGALAFNRLQDIFREVSGQV